jgi:DNA-binding transcriptional LysR family regulator
LDTDSLKLFCDVVDSQNFSLAAVRNHVSQSAVSQQVRKLEATFKTRLLQRGRRVTTPTPAGRAFYDAARAILHRVDQLRADMTAFGSQPSGRLSVATTYSVGLYEIAPAVKAFLERFPQVTLNVDFTKRESVYERCLAETIDLGIVPYPERRKGVDTLSLVDDPLVLICHPDHPLARMPRAALRSLNGRDFVAFAHGMESRRALDRIFHEHKVDVRIVAEFDNIETIKRSVEIGTGVSVVPLVTVRQEVQASTLAKVEFVDFRFRRALAVITRARQPLSPAAAGFVEQLRARR